MTYRSIMTVLTAAADVAPTLDAALVLARHHDAHLEVICMGLGAKLYPVGMMGMDTSFVLTAMSEATARSSELAKAARTRLATEDVRWAVEDTGAQVEGLAVQVAPRARFADLMVLARAAAADADPVTAEVLDAALFGARAPVLVVPAEGLPVWPPARIVIAWDGGDEAMAAVRAARGLLDQATAVSIAVVDPGQWGAEGDDPGGALARHLVRHDIKAEVTVLPRGGHRVSDVLNNHVRDFDAHLVVMGAYAHTRLRQMILGGTTNDMLRNAAVPVLFAH